MIRIIRLPKEEDVQRRYTDWGYNHQTIEALYWRVKCPNCEDGMMFLYAEDDPTKIKCHRCGYRKPVPDLSNTRKYSYEDYRELHLVRDGFAWLFPSQEETKLRKDENV